MPVIPSSKTAVITGAASGIGLAIAIKLSQLGIRLALLDKDEGALNKIVNLFSAEASLFVVDITKEENVRDAIEAVVSKYHTIGILINSAGITGKTNIKSHEVEMENMQSVFAVNFTGSFLMSKYVLPHMLEKNYGRILHIASIAGKEGNAGMIAYSASKAAVIAMTKVQGKEYAETNITINALAPAVIQTALVDAMPAEQVKYMTDKIPMKRCGTLQEVAEMAAFIVSDENSFVTGFTFDLSGGRATY
jgi:NAD(P)-dependent dehydrogenase (short-subunit alcohol dehydrogenase family)